MPYRILLFVNMIFRRVLSEKNILFINTVHYTNSFKFILVMLIVLIKILINGLEI